MARRALKVYRTPTGFHDAYVAAPSRKAALEAWGTDANLFARGAAEEVTDAALIREPLAHPGEVIRVKRGTEAEHLAALSTGSVETRTSRKTAPVPATRKPAPKPRPSRDALDRAEAALDAARKDNAKALAELAQREAALRAERRALETAQAAAVEKLEHDRDRAKAAYAAKIDRWAADG